MDKISLKVWLFCENLRDLREILLSPADFADFRRIYS